MRKLKPLFWRPNASYYSDGETAYTPFGPYHLGNKGGPNGRKEWLWTHNGPEQISSSLEEAKQQCFEHYQKNLDSLFE